MHQTNLFSTPKRPGFNGRQALAKGNNDVFYNTMRSVTSSSTHLVQSYDEARKPATMPKFGAVVFPVVVIDGRLFEAWFDEPTGQMQLEERQQLRLHWRGSPSWSFNTSVDIVVADSVPKFALDRAREVDSLLKVMTKTGDQIASCFESRSLEDLQVSRGPRGVVGVPPLLQEISRMRRQLTRKTGRK